ncbi:hypothetical protein GCM10023322_31870 [Rugosimonospora acidiphila]|uniref:Lipoprotein n=1 Tax=Rugosimonospora acidiphila TaxID=556531 RepID=A0ABP9RUI1_9ACTN
MHRPSILAASGLLALAALAGCGNSSKPAQDSSGSSAPPAATSAAPAANGIDCAKAGDLDATPALKPPANFPMVSDGHLYEAKGPFGKTELFFVWKQADPTNLDVVRDEAANLLVSAGYKLERKDQEEGSEAEATLSGPQTVAIQVIQLCTGRVRVKYQLG